MEHVTTPEPSACELDGVGVSMGLVAMFLASETAGNRPVRHVVSH